jgi:hypothetical protein
VKPLALALLAVAALAGLAAWIGTRGFDGGRVEPASQHARPERVSAGEVSAPSRPRAPSTAPRSVLPSVAARVQAPPIEPFGVVEGRCVDEFGRPLEDVAVVFPPGSSNLLLTRPGGRFGVAYEPALVAESAGLVRFTHTDGASTVLEIPRGSRGRFDVGDVVLEVGGALVGRVLRADGRAAPEARVEAVGWIDGERVARETRADGDGRWRLRGLAGGIWELHAELHGAREREPLVPVVSATSEREELLLQLEPFDPRGMLRGVVVGPDGRPRPGARVKLRAPGRGALGEPVATADGRFEWHAEPGAPCELYAVDFETRELSALVRTACGAPELELLLGAHPRMELAVVDADGRPLSAFGFRVSDPETGGWYGVGTPPVEHEDGVASVPVLARPFELSVLALGHGAARLEGLDVSWGGTRRVVRVERSAPAR